MQTAPHQLPLVSSAMAAVNWFSVRVCAASVELEGASASVPAASEADVVDVVASASLVVAAEVGVVVSVSVVVVVVSGSAIAECELVVFLSQPHLPG